MSKSSSRFKPTGLSPEQEQLAESSIQRVLIIGVSSYLGSCLAVALRDHFEVFGTYFRHPVRFDAVTTRAVDCGNAGEIFETIKLIQPDAVLYCAGFSDPYFCEQNRELADTLHLKSPAVFFKVPLRPFHFVYFSSDQIFGDSPADEAPFSEKEAPTPVNILGSTKAQGESLVMGRGRFTHVLRLGTVFGEASGPTGFARYSFLEAYARKLARRERVQSFEDLRRSFTYVGDVARAVRLFLQKTPPQTSSLYNLASPDTNSFKDFLSLYCEEAGFDRELVQKENKYPGIAFPKNCSLSAEAFEKKYEFKFARTREGLREMVERLEQGYTRNWS